MFCSIPRLPSPSKHTLLTGICTLMMFVMVFQGGLHKNEAKEQNFNPTPTHR